MKFQVTVAGEQRNVELVRGCDGWQCALEGRSRRVDVTEVAPGVLSVLLDGQSFTLRVERADDGYRVYSHGAELPATVENPRRWQGHGGGALGRSGRSEVTAPMPGKVVRILVTEKQAVESGQGLVVVEAMKMQNEIPSPAAGVVESVRVQEGETVEHGKVLIVLAGKEQMH